MPFIHITTWKMNNEEQVKGMLEDITNAVHKNTGAPLDKISVAVTEVAPNRWADAGVVGSEPDFPVKSRRLNYEE